MFEKLLKSKIGVNIHYKPIYRQSYYSKFKFNINNFKSSEYYYENCISIPIYSGLSVSNQDFVIKKIEECLK